jgi:hypothetical protein
MTEERHDCSQGATLATICAQLKNIEDDIKEMKETQKRYLEDQKLAFDLINAANINRARYPPPDDVARYFKRVDAHDIYFAIMGVCLIAMFGWVSGGLSKLLGWG